MAKILVRPVISKTFRALALGGPKRQVAPVLTETLQAGDENAQAGRVDEVKSRQIHGDRANTRPTRPLNSVRSWDAVARSRSPMRRATA